MKVFDTDATDERVALDPQGAPDDHARADAQTAVAVLDAPGGAPSAPADEGRVADDGPAPVDVLLTSASVFLAAAAAGWMAAGVFTGSFARVVAVLGALFGAGTVALSFRTSRPSIVQYLALPGALVVGALLVVPDATGGTANLPGLVAEAIRTGGIAQPPVPFDPGWRFILFVLTAFVAASGASLATGLDRPKLGLFVPMPLLVGAALVQPQEATALSTVVALVAVVAALAVSYGVELAREGATSTGFEVRRLGRGAGAIVVLVGVFTVLSQAGFLFPDTERDQVIPPKRPEVQPPQADRVLFEVGAERPGPWRLGVLDVYEDDAWLLPPYETARFVDVPTSGVLPATSGARPDDDRDTYEVRFRIADVEGHVIPTIAEAARVRRADGFALTFDPRTQMFRLPEGRARRGMTYTVAAPVPPSGAQLAEAPPPPESMRAFLEAPAAPQVVADLLAQAPEENLWDRLQFVRTAFYSEVVAAGAGEPVDLPAFRVADMLEGGEGTPYEITAAEVLLARWAGVPSRMGYGFYSGDRRGQTWEVHPRHGATWLESYFDGYGWVPIIGKPPKAKASTSDDQKQQDPNIRPTDELALVVYVPIKLQSIRLLYTLVRYWVAVTLPILLAIAAAWAFFPYPLKLARRFRRRRWAESRGPLERIVVEYAEFRDAANDVGVGDTTLTPLEFLDVIERDAEHHELAWLVTRCLWGDLNRDVRDEDAEAAHDMARSVVRRLRAAQPALNRLIGAGTRLSLRDPYTTDVPNLWPAWARPGALGRATRRAGAVLARPFRVVRRVLPVGGLLAALLLAGCSSQPAVATRAELPEPLVPDALGAYEFRREAEAEQAFERAGDDALVAPDGRVYTVRDGDDVLGSLQAAVFVDAFRSRDASTRDEALDAIKRNIGSGRFERKRVAGFTIEEMRLAEQRILLWVPEDGSYYELFVARQGFEEADRVFTALLAFQRGAEAQDALDRPHAELADPRRGAPQ